MNPLLSVGFMLLAAIPQASSSSRLPEVLQKIERDHAPGDERISALTDAYYAGVPSEVLSLNCEAIKKELLDDLFVAAHLVAFHAPNTELVDQLACIHNALESANASTRFHHRKLHGMLVKSRRFHEANQLRLRHELQVPALPSLSAVGDSGPHVLVTDEEGGIKLEPWNIDSEWSVIAVVHPHCSPSRRAMDAVFNTPSLDWLRQRLRLLMPAGPYLLQAEVIEWNATHPGHPIALEVPGRGLQGIRTDETPLFYLVRNGEVVDSLRGWSDGPMTVGYWRDRINEELAGPGVEAEKLQVLSTNQLIHP